MKDLSNFEWGWLGENSELARYHKNGMIGEIFDRKQYEEIYQVKEEDVVVDIGASVGPFTYSILDKNPKMVYCLEPSNNMFEAITKNLPFDNVTLIKKGISHSDGITSLEEQLKLFGGEGEFEGTKFSTFIKDNNLNHIDFLKTDCEGGEYHIFTDENIDFLLNNVGCIVGEWHLDSNEKKIEFRYFRDKYLKKFKNIEVRSIDGFDITWDLWNEHFIEYYKQVILHISNK
jgi:FkbM family methyltransferase